MDAQEKLKTYTPSKENNVAVHCSGCGEDAHFGQAECGHCGFNLLKKGTEGVNKFLIPDSAKMFTPDEKTQHMDLPRLLEHIKGSLGTSEDYMYVMWKGLPALVGPGITPEDARDNWLATHKAIERERLGESWATALNEFRELMKDMETMKIKKRIAAGKRFEESFGEHRRFPSTISEFFRAPSFSLMTEEVMRLYPGSNDAGKLSNSINNIRDFIPKHG